ncbi:MAG: T9SS type A sorting domain-containing protein [Bacteroidota bacterium]
MKTNYTILLLILFFCLSTKQGNTQESNFTNTSNVSHNSFAEIRKKITDFYKSNKGVVQNSANSQAERVIAFASVAYDSNGQVQSIDSIKVHYNSPNIGWLLSSDGNDEIFGIDTAYGFSYFMGNLIKLSRYVLQYNSDGYYITQREDTLANSNWNLVSITNTTRNSNNKILSEISTPPSYKTEYTYDANGNILTKISSNWTGSQYQINNSDSYTYYPNNTVLTSTTSYYQNGEINSIQKDSIIYNASNLPLTNFRKNTLFSGGTTYSSLSKISNTYSSDNLLMSLTQNFDLNSSTYINSNKVENTFNGSNLISSLTQSWNSNDNSWHNNSRTSKSYQGNNVVLEIYEYWDFSNLIWLNVNKVENTYSQFNNIQINTNYQYVNQVWQPIYSQHNYYELFTPNNIDETSFNSFSIYPNPSKNSITIYGSNLSGISQLNVFDVTGKNVFTLQLSNNDQPVTVPINQLSKGIYIVSIVNNGKTSFSKLIKE